MSRSSGRSGGGEFAGAFSADNRCTFDLRPRFRVHGSGIDIEFAFVVTALRDLLPRTLVTTSTPTPTSRLETVSYAAVAEVVSLGNCSTRPLKPLAAASARAHQCPAERAPAVRDGASTRRAEPQAPRDAGRLRNRAGRGGLTVANLPEGLRAAIGGPAHGL